MSTENSNPTPEAQPEIAAAPSVPSQETTAPNVEAAPAAEATETTASPEGGGAAAPAAVGEAGEAPKKKRRRRRRRKKAGDPNAPKVEGAPGEAAAAEGSEAGEADDGAEGDEEGDEKADDGEAAPAAEGEAAPGAEAGEKKAKKPQQGQQPGPGKKAKKRPAGPPREKPPFGAGEEVVGKIINVMDEALMIDVSGKALGIFDRSEAPTSEVFTEGERFIGKVANDGARGGLVVLTRDLNRWQLARTEVEQAFKDKQPVAGLITGVIKGGVEVDVRGLRGFAPASHVDLRLGADLHYLIGQRVPFEVVQFAKRGREFVLSRKGALEEAARAVRGEVIGKLPVGEVVKGVVRSVTQFGAFVDVGGVDGLVHMTEASHVVAPLNQIFKVGDEIEVKILRVDEKGKVWLSRKAVEKDPWEGAAERYARGTLHKAKVVRLQPFGAFIELEPGIDGLMHISDMPSTKRLAHPSEVMKVGDELEVVVAQNDIEKHKIGLQMAPKEGEVPLQREREQQGERERPPPRLAMHGAVKVIVEAQELTGLVVQIVGQTGRNAKGYITAMATGTPKGTDLRRVFPVGKELDAKIIEMGPRGIKLSISALAKDQERQSFRQYQNQVKQTAKFGTFGDLLAKKGITK